MVDSILDKLEIFNDPKFLFDEEAHRYTYEGKDFISVTTFIQKFHKPFEKEKWSKYKADQRGITVEEILKEWQDLNDYSNIVGSELHNWIEDYYNKKWRPISTNLDIIDRINKFNIIYANQLSKLEPIIFEKRVFSKKWMIAGMIDSIFLYKNKIYILDWKTNKEFLTDEDHKGRYENLLYPFESYYKNHLNEYSLQICLYALILEDIGLEIKGGYLVHIGPNTPAKIHKVNDVRKELRIYLDENYAND